MRLRDDCDCCRSAAVERPAEEICKRIDAAAAAENINVQWVSGALGAIPTRSVWAVRKLLLLLPRIADGGAVLVVGMHTMDPPPFRESRPLREHPALLCFLLQFESLVAPSLRHPNLPIHQEETFEELEWWRLLLLWAC